MSKNKSKKKACRHDYNNATPVGKVDYICPLCKELIDPQEWFFMTYMDSLGVKFIENGHVAEMSPKK
jgi:hypothetical protein